MASLRLGALALMGLSLVGSLAACSKKATPTPAPEPTPFIHDAQGRALILRGINIDGYAKWNPLPDITEPEVDHIAHAWGMNFARVILTWDKVEPQEGTIDMAYLDGMATRLDWFEQRGIRVMLDMHQDTYGRRCIPDTMPPQCPGDGAPLWAFRDDGQSYFGPEDPAHPRLWSLYYAQAGIIRCFDNLWASSGANADLLQHFAAAWAAVAQRLGKHPAVIGYDLFNEPFPGSLFNLSEALSGEAADGGSSQQYEGTLLGPFYQNVITEIRKVDSDGYIFIEPRYGAAASGAVSFFPKMVDPRSGESRIVLAPHLYVPEVDAGQDYIPNKYHIDLWEKSRAAEMKKQPMPIMMGEWGFQWPVDPTTNALNPDRIQYADDVLAMADRMMMGWAYWAYDPAPPGNWALAGRDPMTHALVDNPQADVVVRTFPHAIAGQPVSFSFDTTSHVFTLTFQDKAGVTGPTEIFLAPHIYPNGYDLQVSDAAGTWSQSFDTTTNVLSITVPTSKSNHVIQVTPK